METTIKLNKIHCLNIPTGYKLKAIRGGEIKVGDFLFSPVTLQFHEVVGIKVSYRKVYFVTVKDWKENKPHEFIFTQNEEIKIKNLNP